VRNLTVRIDAVTADAIGETFLLEPMSFNFSTIKQYRMWRVTGTDGAESRVVVKDPDARNSTIFEQRFTLDDRNVTLRDEQTGLCIKVAIGRAVRVTRADYTRTGTGSATSPSSRRTARTAS